MEVKVQAMLEIVRISNHPFAIMSRKFAPLKTFLWTVDRRSSFQQRSDVNSVRRRSNFRWVFRYPLLYHRSPSGSETTEKKQLMKATELCFKSKQISEANPESACHGQTSRPLAGAHHYNFEKGTRENQTFVRVL